MTMSWRGWLAFVVCVVSAAPVAAQGPNVLPDAPLPPVVPLVVPPPEAPVQDLTPPQFADLIPAPDPHHAEHAVPGHLAPTAPGHTGFFATAEYLLFRPRSDALDFAIPNENAGLGIRGPVESLRYANGNGLRVEAGYRCDCNWDFGFAYTYLNATGQRGLGTGPGRVLFPTLTRPGLTDSVLSADAESDLNYNLYDLLLGRRFVVDEHLAVRAFGGIRFADIGRRFDVRYDGLDARQAALCTRSGFDGFGPILGAEAVVGGWRGFHLYARASGGLLTGRTTNRVFETNNAGGTVYVDSRYDVRKVVPVGTLGIGGGWQYRSFSFRAGYEITQWGGIFEPVRFADDVGRGKLATRPANLSLEGLFLQVGYTF